MKPLHVIRGKVRSGKKRGRNLGFPTANIALHTSIPSGIYISLVNLRTQTFPALTFIGEAKTFNEKLYQAETYILDFTDDIYNLWLSISLIKKIRDNKKFTDAERLIEEIKSDEKVARDFFKEANLLIS